MGENGGGGLLLRDSGRTQRLAGREGPEEAGEREGCGGGDRGARVDGGGQGGQGSLQKGDVGNSGAPPSSAGAGDRGRPGLELDHRRGGGRCLGSGAFLVSSSGS